MNIEENIRLLLDQLRRATVRLVDFQPGDKLPRRMMSGFVMRREGRCFVVTAAHSVGSGRWWLELDAQRRGAPAGILVPFSAHWILTAEITLPGEERKVDLAWAEVDLARLQADAAKDPELDSGSVQFVEYRGPLGERPEVEEPYAFCALNQQVAGPLRSGNYWLERRPAFEVGMEYTGDHSRDAAYVFKLARPHKGHDYYKGASGAPIADSTGKIISVVLSGDPRENSIFGAKLADYADLIGVDLSGENRD